MAGKVSRTPRARRDLMEIWQFIADDNEPAADHFLDRVDGTLAMLGDNPFAGRARPELAMELRSFPVGKYVLFYRPVANGIDLIRALSGYLDIRPEDMD